MKIRYAWARRASQNQRDVLLAFASVLDKKLDAIGHSAALQRHLVRATCRLHCKPDSSATFWQGWNRLHAAMGRKFNANSRRARAHGADTPQ